MSTEQLPDGLQQTGINSQFNACMYRDDCRAEHAQRVTLQHHAADLAQRVALLDALLRSMQADAVEYLRPDGGRDAAWIVGRMLRHLDGPEQRAAQGAAS